MTTADEIMTPAGSMRITRAEPGDERAIVEIDLDVRQWLLSRDIDPGQPPRPIEDIVADRVAAGQVYLASIGGDPVATVTLLWEDPESWGDVPNDAVYVHGLAVRRAAAGNGIGRALLDWAARTAVAAGRAHVRLDCMASNPALRDYYVRTGFTYRGDVTLGRYTLSRYEKSAREG
ncbi:MAG TPA: GNAT family N-acetyltransferase [Ktedonobacterales bacterium]